jgi:predicted nucleotidyltransferase
MKSLKLKKLVSIINSFPEIKLAYHFGSTASGSASPLSDYDFAFYLDTNDKKRMYEIRFELFDKISRLLKTDNVDIVIINLSGSPELKYHIIRYGKLIFEKEPFKVIVEPKILNEYFDFQSILLRYNLTEA